jgi:Uma2 family endonuclease
MTLHEIEAPTAVRTVRSLVRISTDQYHRMIEQGILPESASMELIDGLIREKDRADVAGEAIVHSPAHVLAISLLAELGVRINGPKRHLKIQLPVCIAPSNEPEPDAMIVRGGPRDYADRLPGPADVFCIIEVAGSSLEIDLHDKLPVYASAGIAQYVIVNLRHGVIEIYSRPDPALGGFAAKEVKTKTDAVRLHLGDGETLDVPAADLLP